MQNITVDFNLMDRYKNMDGTPSAEWIKDRFGASLGYFGRGHNYEVNSVTEIPSPETNSYIVQINFTTINPLFEGTEQMDNDVKKDIMFAVESVQFHRNLVFHSHKPNLALAA